ncbi:peptidase dimerization domain-containing protein [Hydrogenimonas urashimensis]|uniref:peptidase dimerization domain-containing protein n=1 Tax=Hydrogenimonas urashimensis TaxID=2740515 RepID=UPI0019153677|nr:peptidase dimerization domain-containing protein [Hydrogenimonas urashimensis]
MADKCVIHIFSQLSRIPHCSGDTEAMRHFLKNFAASCGYRVEIDRAGNVMAYGKGSRVTFQSHYDMVCIAKAPAIELVVQKGWMSAKESSLGADNGIGVAIMLCLMKKGTGADFLFTNDEEIGLLGARDLDLRIRTPYLLNLDSEEFGKVYIGCAGGEDVFVRKDAMFQEAEGSGAWFAITAEAPGGHSGVNIADNLPNAITELAGVLTKNHFLEIASVEGGERINAIPRHAKAIVWSPEGILPVSDSPHIRIEETGKEAGSVLVDGKRLAEALFGFAHGVRAWNRELSLPQSSINLAKVFFVGDEIEIALSARSMANKDLERLVEQSVAGWDALGYSCRREGKYPAWEPVTNPFSEKVLALYRTVEPDASYAAIHAGLECALFAHDYPHLKIASIGPTILDPHSDRERVKLSTVEKVMHVVERIVADLSSI